MQLVLNEDQQLIAKTAADFMAAKSPVSRFRALRDQRDATGFSRALWKEMAELGWLGIPFDEELGGAGMGLAEFVLVMEEAGRVLAPEPLLSSVALAGRAIALGGSDAQKESWLAPMIEGEKILSLAHQEACSRYDIHRIECRASATGDGWRLEGEKIQVPDGHVADAIIVAARLSGEVDAREGIALFLVPSGAAGLGVDRQTRLDSRNAALVRLEGVQVGADALIGREGEGGRLLEDVIDWATVALCAEMLGGMSQAFDMTLAYLKERQQFGVLIGTFQALKHRAAHVFMEIELSRSTVMAAARALDAGDEGASKLVSLAKARCSDAYVLAGNEGVQMFGGVGMTDEYDIGFHMKRARAAELTFGDSAFHRERWARLSEY